MSQLRLLAARVIDEVTDGHSLSDVLDAAISHLSDTRDRAFVKAVCFGVCRFYPRLDVILSHLLQKPMKAKDSDVHALLLVGLYQLMDMRVPAHAAVAETVNAIDAMKKPWAKSLVNAVLRNYLRSRESIEEQIKNDEEAHYAHPYWWIRQLKKAWPQEWQSILNANNEHPPFSLRVNHAHLSREAYLTQLREQEMQADIISETRDGIILSDALAVEALPGFREGDIFVQDGAAQLAASLLQLEPHFHVLDACAAPGGKLTHLLESESTLEIVAVEKNAQRILAIKDNLNRLKLQCEVICGDAAKPHEWWNKTLFDRILLDVPCSASGVVRRHPDIKLLREESDVAQFAHEQMQLLKALWPTLKPNGLLLYATCSIFPGENVEVLKQFLAEHADASEEKIESTWGVECEVGRQILPGMHNMDGFYYGRLRKAAAF